MERIVVTSEGSKSDTQEQSRSTYQALLTVIDVSGLPAHVKEKLIAVIGSTLADAKTALPSERTTSMQVTAAADAAPDAVLAAIASTTEDPASVTEAQVAPVTVDAARSTQEVASPAESTSQQVDLAAWLHLNATDHAAQLHSLQALLPAEISSKYRIDELPGDGKVKLVYGDVTTGQDGRMTGNGIIIENSAKGFAGHTDERSIHIKAVRNGQIDRSGSYVLNILSEGKINIHAFSENFSLPQSDLDHDDSNITYMPNANTEAGTHSIQFSNSGADNFAKLAVRLGLPVTAFQARQSEVVLQGLMQNLRESFTEPEKYLQRTSVASTN